MLQVTGSDDVFAGMAQTLECFKTWLDEGAGGATGWTLEPENHEGWRVVVDEGEQPHDIFDVFLIQKIKKKKPNQI